MTTIGAPGTGFSSIDPTKSVETIAGIVARSRMKSIRKSSRRSSSTPPSTAGVVKEIIAGEERATALYSYTDPVTGKTTFTSSREFADTASRIGTDNARRSSGGGTPIAYASEQAARDAAQLKELQRLSSIAKTEKNRQQLLQSQNKILERQAKAELNRIIAERSRLIRQGAKERKTKSTDYKSGDKLEVTIWRLKDGTMVKKTKNLTTGTVEYTSYKAFRKGGKVYMTGGVTKGAIGTRKMSARELAIRVRIKKSNDPNKIIVTFPNGRTGTVNAKGTVIVGKALAGNKYMFKDGVIIAVDGKSTFAREEFVPVNEVELIKKESNSIKRWNKNISDLRKIASTARARGNIKSINEAKLLGYTFVTTVIDGGTALIGLPSTVANIVRNPSILKQIPGAMAKAGENFGILLRTSPSEAWGVIAGEILLLKGTNLAFKQAGSLSSRAFIRLNPKFIGKAKIGKTLNIKTGKGKFTNLKVVGKIPKEKLLSQVNKQGKKLTAISSQADDWIGLVRKKGVVRKPIPGEANFNKVTKSLLNKLDKGTITKSELLDLDLLVRSQGAKGLLERGFFADPTGKIRPSRLGVVDSKRAGLMDYLSGDITFKKARPQIFLFEDIKVAKFPKGLQGVAKKIKAGKTLTRAEANALLEWQLKKSGKFKPLGFISGESEITLAPGEILRKVKTVGVTSIKGKRVPIIKVEVLKQTGVIKTLVKKLDDGIITAAERIRLSKLLKSKTGFNYGLSSSPSVSSRYVPIRRIGFSFLASATKKLKSGRISPRLKSKPRLISKTGKSLKTYKIKVTKYPRKPIKRTSKSPPSKPGKSPTKRPPKKPSKKPTPKKKPPVIPKNLPKQFKRKTISKSQPVYMIKVKKKGRLVNLAARPLILRDAKDYLAYSIDNNLTRTAYFEPIGRTKKVVRIPKAMIGYYNKNKNKLRPYKIRVGKKKLLRNGYIEKRKYIQDTRKEKSQLARAKNKTPRKSTKKKTTIKKNKKR